MKTARRTPLIHLATRVLREPLAMHPGKLEVILGAIGPRLGLRAAEGAFGLEERGEEPAGAPAPSSIAVITVDGSLVARGGYMDAESGLASYPSIAAALDEALTDSKVGGIILEIDSYGGEVQGLFELADTVAAARDVKPVWGVAQHNAYSAGYALASATERLYVTRAGGVGSIGVVAVHTDQSGADRDLGVDYTFLHAGEKKVDGHGHAPLSDRARDAIQARVDRLYGEFVATVAKHGRLSAEQVRATQAGTYTGAEAVEAGLADEVGTLQDAIAAMQAHLTKTKREGRRFVRASKEMTHAR